MTSFYEVSVERFGFGYCDHIKVAAAKPELAAEAAERLAAGRLAGDGWATIIHQFFAYSIREAAPTWTTEWRTPAGWRSEQHDDPDAANALRNRLVHDYDYVCSNSRAPLDGASLHATFVRRTDGAA